MAPYQFPFLLFFLSVTAADSAAERPHSLIQTVPESPNPADWMYCDSWRLTVETNNARFWRTIPPRCRGFVEEYVRGDRYASDSDFVAAESLAFASSVRVCGDGKDVWVFDIDDTLLSNIPYYAVNGYGSRLFNETAFNEWIQLGRAPALPASLRLYQELLVLGFKLILLSGRSESQRKITEENLLLAGYRAWSRLILREPSEMAKHALVFKSERRKELQAQGFKIHGNSGDQWNDLLGSPMAERSFKLPNPMYHTG